MKKIFAVILLLITAFALSACGSYPVEGEKNAIDVYTCSDKNMLGLEKLVIFEDHIVLVFDRKAPKVGYELDVDQIMRSKVINTSVSITGVNNYQATGKYESSAEIFIVTIYVSGPNGDTKVINPVQGSSLSQIGVEDYLIDINSGNLRISRNDATAEGSVLHYQDYNQVSKKWSKIFERSADGNIDQAA